MVTISSSSGHVKDTGNERQLFTKRVGPQRRNSDLTASTHTSSTIHTKRVGPQRRKSDLTASTHTSSTIHTERVGTQRRNSDLTASTHTSSTIHTCSTTNSSPCNDLLITAITQEMIKSLMHAATSGQSPLTSSSSHGVGGGNELEDATNAIRALVQMSSQDLQSLVLSKLANSSLASDPSTRHAMDNSVCSSNNGSFAVDSKAPSQAGSKGSTTASNTGNQLQDYLANLDEVASESDDSSVISDISGLTGVFSEHSKMSKFDRAPCPRVLAANEARTKQQAARAAAGAAAPRKVSTSFGSVNVRYYERIASDNPASATGPSIGIGWNFEEREKLTVDEWEKERLAVRGTVFQPLSAKRRTSILLKAGISNKEIVDMIRVINKSRSQRKSTVDNLSAQKLEEIAEQTKRTLGRFLFGNKTGLVEC
jgi:hypothetical protein